ncbi:SapB/AmfS family lantipeptide [Nocardiopsis sp. HUAS JQ3]|nr:SapB/AmfS family lantipeptide [Nocardiopsis sp. HUAS JQ3]WDZ90874.1 SapB/AmfS family lantipeptide [Nocardiopsis sp. HUAS JQ3]
MIISDVLSLQSLGVLLEAEALLNSGLSYVGCSGDVIVRPA